MHAFNVGVHKDILHDGINSMVSEVGDFEDFARKLSQVNMDEKLRCMIGDKARKSSLKFYNQESVELWDAALK